MERNANDTFGNQNTGTSSNAGASSAANTGSTGGASMSGSAGSTDNFSRDTSSDGAGLRDKAQNLASTATERLGNVGASVRDRAGSLKDTLADALESGADRLRQQGAGGGQIAGANATGGSAGMIADDNRLAQTSNQLAGGLQASADWLRDFDVDGMKAGIEKQVKEHPGRTLAIAVGLGYLLGKALRK